MARLSLSNAFSPMKRGAPTKKGNAGYDNARENIDPRIITKTIITQQGVFGNITIESATLKKDIGDLRVGGLLYANIVNSNIITNDTTEINFDTNVTFPANSLKIGQVIRLKCGGSIARTGAPSINLRIRLGGQTMIASGVAAASAGTAWSIECDIHIRTLGIVGTVGATGHYDNGRNEADLDNPSANTNTTTDSLLTVTAQWNTAAAANQIKIRNISVEVF